MFPGFSIYDQAYHRPGNAPVAGYLVLPLTLLVFFADRIDFFVGQYGIAMLLATGVGPLGDLVLGVFPGRPIPQVGKSIIGWVAVGEVTALHSPGGWPDERLQNQTVNGTAMSLRVAAESDDVVSEFVQAGVKPVPDCADEASRPLAYAKASFPPATPYRPIIADTVAGETWNVAVLDGKINVRHGSPPAQVSGVQSRLTGLRPAGLLAL